MNRTLLAHLALLAVALLYGGNYIIAKQVMNNELLQPLGFVLLRTIAAGVLFWICHFATVRRGVRWKHLPRLALCGLLGVAINQSLFFSGLELTTPIHASLIMTSTPILVLIAAQILLRERITNRKIAGIALAGGGAIFLLLQGQSLDFARNTLLGDMMVLVNAMSYGLYLVIVKKLLDHYHPLTVITWVFTFGFLYMLPVGFNQLASAPWHRMMAGDWLSILYVLIGVSFLAYLFNILALREVSPSVVSIYIYLQPLFASFLSILIYHEKLDIIKLLSAALIFTGVYLVSFGKKAATS